MARQRPVPSLAFLLLTLVSLFFITSTSAANPTSFCKCTCGTESKIIPLKGTTCLDCNRQFCLSYNLPICKETKEADVFTTCFRKLSFSSFFSPLLSLISTSLFLIFILKLKEIYSLYMLLPRYICQNIEIHIYLVCIYVEISILIKV